MANYEEMTIPELEKVIQGMAAQVLEIKAEQRKAHAVLDEKVIRADLVRKLANLTDPEKAALVQMIQAEGVEGQEGVGIPGAIS